MEAGPNRGELFGHCLFEDLPGQNGEVPSARGYRSEEAFIAWGDRAWGWQKHQQAACGCDSGGNKRCDGAEGHSAERVERGDGALR